MSIERQQQQKDLLITQLEKTPIIQIACEKLSVARATYYRWRQQDKEFAKRADAAITAGELLINDLAESQLLSAIRDKNFSAIAFWLKHHHHRYTTRVEVTAQLKRVPEQLTPEQEIVIKKALQLAALIPTIQLENKQSAALNTTEKENVCNSNFHNKN